MLAFKSTKPNSPEFGLLRDFSPKLTAAKHQKAVITALERYNQVPELARGFESRFGYPVNAVLRICYPPYTQRLGTRDPYVNRQFSLVSLIVETGCTMIEAESDLSNREYLTDRALDLIDDMNRMEKAIHRQIKRKALPPLPEVQDQKMITLPRKDMVKLNRESERREATAAIAGLKDSPNMKNGVYTKLVPINHPNIDTPPTQEYVIAAMNEAKKTRRRTFDTEDETCCDTPLDEWIDKCIVTSQVALKNTAQDNDNLFVRSSLLQFMDIEPEVNGESIPKEPSARQIKQRKPANNLAERVAQEFNNVPTHTKRTVAQLMKCWENVKGRKKRELAERQREVMKTGGGRGRPSPQREESDATVEAFVDEITDIELPTGIDSDSIAMTSTPSVASRQLESAMADKLPSTISERTRRIMQMTKEMFSDDSDSEVGSDDSYVPVEDEIASSEHDTDSEISESELDQDLINGGDAGDTSQVQQNESVTCSGS
ncbi:hypothetical protein GE061_001409 [Apolygus lucorum]|uniref:Regulatory protein zeste n=1 Tax=Apolygus lucorum TaxID=248454 RepID=A0A8S9YAZ8_APOLU|nr:hypothetical protein GE061_001409 [Apolygus lucorum]